MEFEDFIEKVKPRGFRAKLVPLRDQILDLDAMDYSYLQIRDWLQMKGVFVSLEAVAEFVELRHASPRFVLKITKSA